MTPRTYFEKVWTDHAIAPLGDDSEMIHIDRLVLHEWTAATIVPALVAGGRKPARRELVLGVVAHLIDTAPGRGPNQSYAPSGPEVLAEARHHFAKLGLRFFDIGDPRQGIVHVIAPENGIALPGTTLVCGDSHTCTNGGVGALAWGIGTSEAEHALATQTLPQVRPKTMRVRFEGRLGEGVLPKDMILHLIGRHGANGGIGYAIEFAGSAVRALPVEGRLTLCNMVIEFSGRYGFVPPDDTTLQYLHGREFSPKGAAWDEAAAYWRSLLTEPEAAFDREIEIDCDAIAPHVTWGTSPQHVLPIDGRVPDETTADDPGTKRQLERAFAYMRLAPGTPIAGVPIDAAFIGSCTNGRLSDLRAAAAVVKGRRVADGVQAVCIPGSSAVKKAAEAEGLDRVFTEAGFEWHESGCGLCADMGNKRLADRRVISTTNRNFEGRQGPATRTHLASPATVAASALAGRISDPRRRPA
ncbi:MAG: 3-isopropylmalate dehydratase large subunit [Alphaproteobacteria bacterium]